MKTLIHINHQMAVLLLVHNGVIENYEELKGEYLQGVSFISETDTEVIVQLVEYFSNQGLQLRKHLQKLCHYYGSYALGLLDAEDKDTPYSC